MKGEIWSYPNIDNPQLGGPTKHRFMPRYSLLDDYHKDSKMHNSEYRGIFNLMVIIALFFLVVRPLNNHFQMGSYFNRALLDSVRNELFSCLMIWPLFSLWSYFAFVHEKLQIMGYNGKLLYLLKHCSQCVMLVFGIIVVVMKDWPATHRTFVILQMMVHFMKMHSYSNTNRDYRMQAQEAHAKGERPLTSYPLNVNIRDFAHYMIMPVLVYQEKYPLRQNRDYFYIAKTMLSLIVCLVAVYLIQTDYIIPFIELGNRISLFELLSRSLLPTTLFMLLLFYIVFECVCNIFGELSCFADRCFYKDWWNSTTFEEFNRLWNQPVHEFLYRHVYLEAIMQFKTSKKQAQFLTFLFSAVLHELVLAVVFKIVRQALGQFRPILFAFMLGQIPLFWLTKNLINTKFGNYLFWFGITFGPSLIICLYLRVDERVTSHYENHHL